MIFVVTKCGKPLYRWMAVQYYRWSVLTNLLLSFAYLSLKLYVGYMQSYLCKRKATNITPLKKQFKKLPQHISFHISTFWGLEATQSSSEARSMACLCMTAVLNGISTISFYYSGKTPVTLYLEIARQLELLSSCQLNANEEFSKPLLSSHACSVTELKPHAICALKFGDEADSPGKGNLVNYVWESATPLLNSAGTVRVYFFGRDHGKPYLERLSRNFKPPEGQFSFEQALEARIRQDFPPEPQLLVMVPQVAPSATQRRALGCIVRASIPFYLRIQQLDNYPAWELSLTEIYLPHFQLASKWAFSILTKAWTSVELAAELVDGALSQFQNCEMRFGK